LGTQPSTVTLTAYRTYHNATLDEPRVIYKTENSHATLETLVSKNKLAFLMLEKAF
jgi:hypothetical protein